jgi:hypothetical protein
MIQNHRSRIRLKRTLHHDSRVNLRPVNRSLEHLLKTQHAMPVIEKHCAEVFGFTVVEFEPQILSLALERGINVYAVKGNWQLDQSVQSKIIAMAFSMAAEIERDLISQRTIEALRAKKAAGMKLGRPKGPGKSRLDAFRLEIEALLIKAASR